MSYVGILALAACGFEDTAVSTADPEADAGTSEPGYDAGDGDSGGDTDAPPGPEPAGCELIDCGPGHCELDGGAPVCVCDEGHASIGYACVPCSEAGTTTELDLPRVVVTGRVLINGDVPPDHLYEYGELYLRNPATGDEVFLGNTYEGTYEATAVPGTYDLVYARRSGGSAVPANESGHVGRFLVDNHEPIDIEIDVTTVAGTIRFGGSPPPSNLYDNGRIVLRHALSGDRVVLAETHEQEFMANVLPGTYSVHYERLAASTVAPVNPDTWIGEVEVPATSEIIVELPLDIPIVEVQGNISLAGAPPPDQLYENGRLIFVDRSTGAEIEVAQTHQGEYAVRLVAGDYDIVYGHLAGTMLPRNKRARLLAAVHFGSSQSLDVDIPVVALATSVTVSGEQPPDNIGDDGVLRLHDPETGDVVSLGHTRHGSLSTLVVPGEYEVRYAQATAGAILPANLDAVIAKLFIGDVDTLEVDIPVVEVHGEITINGDAPPSSEYSDGRLYLQNPETGDSALLGNTRLGAFEARVVPGRYHVVYAVETTGDGVPLNGVAYLGEVDVAATPEFSIDVPFVRLNGEILVAGAPPPTDDDDNHGVLFLHDPLSTDRLPLGDTRDGIYSTRVTAGQYLVGYRVLASDGLVPQNTDTLFACITVDG